MKRKISQLEKRFGKRGRKGYEGEQWLFKVLTESKQYDEVKDFTKEYFMQKSGIDGAVYKKIWGRSYYFDCKNNLIAKKDGSFLIYLEWTKAYGRPGWFRASKADRIYHTNLKKKISIFYDLKQLRKVVRNLLKEKKIKVETKGRYGQSYILFSNRDKNFKDLLRFQY